MIGRFTRVTPATRVGERLAEAGPRLINDARNATPRRSGAASRSWRAQLIGVGGRRPRLEISNEMPYGMVLVFGHRGPYDIPNAFGYGPSFGIGGRFSGHFHPANRANQSLQAWAASIPGVGRIILRDAAGDILRDLRP